MYINLGWRPQSSTSTQRTLRVLQTTTLQSAIPHSALSSLNFMLIRPHSAFARIENHYFVNTGFMRDGQLLEEQQIDKMSVTSTLYWARIEN